MTADNVKHTPGPWFAKGRYIGTKNHMSAIGECRDVNGNWSNDAPASANARLIAAAPDLLSTLREIAGNGDGTGRNPQLMVDAALAAIARAEGRS